MSKQNSTNLDITKYLVFTFVLLLGYYIATSTNSFLKKSTSTSTKAAPLQSPQKYIGGEDVKPGEFPSVAIIMKDNNGICTGVLIKPQWVLTAAHCTFDSVFPTSVVIGVVNRSEFSTNRIKINMIQRFTTQKVFEEDNTAIDLALLRLVNPVQIDEKYIPKLPIPGIHDDLYISTVGSGRTKFGKNTLVKQNSVIGVGWGCVEMKPTPIHNLDYTSFINQILPTIIVYSDKLQKLTLPIYKDKSVDHPPNFEYGYSGERSLRRTPCFGDSGGPLFSESKPEYVIGIQSRSESGLKQSSSEAVRIIDYTERILKYIEANSL